ncbi:MAG: TraM recognition domain-containing protein [Elusimicrobia bacterium]|nr:TraM recognition domain-containing protein [Elusimicrobiota bacterium]
MKVSTEPNAFSRKKTSRDNLITDIFDMIIKAIAIVASLIWLAWKFQRDEIVERRRLFVGLSILFVACLLIRFFFLDSLAAVFGLPASAAIRFLSWPLLAFLPYLLIRLFVTLWVSAGIAHQARAESWLTAAFFVFYFALPFGLYCGIMRKQGISFLEKTAEIYGCAGQSLEARVRAFFFDQDYLVKITRNALRHIEHSAGSQRLLETISGRPNKKFRAKRIVKPKPDPQPFFYLLLTPLWMGFWFYFWALVLGDRLVNNDRKENKEALNMEPLKDNPPIPIAKRGPKIPVDQLNRHSLTVGTTGAGKTSFMLYVAKELLRRNFGLMFIDPKSDPANLELLSRAAHALGREMDLVALELGHPGKSAAYNPLLRGNPSMLTDKIMTSTDWSEAYYEKKAREALLLVFSALEQRYFAVSFHDLYLLLTNPQIMRHLADEVDDPFLKKSLLSLSGQLKDLAGLTSYLLNLVISFPQTNTYGPNLDLLDAYLGQKIVYVGLSINAFRDTSKIFGRLLFTDLQATTAIIQSERIKPRPFGVFVDEAGSVLTQGSVDWLNKCRSAGFLACLGVQSLADMDTVSDTFKTQVMANTNNLFVFRPNDHEGTEMLAMTFGTKDTIKKTEAYDNWGISTGYSEREVKEFHMAPDTIKELPNGKAAVLIRGDRVTRGVWNLHRLHGQEGSFDELLPNFRNHVAMNKRGFDAEGFLRRGEPQEERRLIATGNAANGPSTSDPLPPKPSW